MSDETGAKRSNVAFHGINGTKVSRSVRSGLVTYITRQSRVVYRSGSCRRFHPLQLRWGQRAAQQELLHHPDSSLRLKTVRLRTAERTGAGICEAFSPFVASQSSKQAVMQVKADLWAPVGSGSRSRSRAFCPLSWASVPAAAPLQGGR